MKQYNLNKNFSDFRDNISLTAQEKQNLTNARKIIRATIRKTFNEMPTRYFTDEHRIFLADFSKNTDKKVKPRFMTQGSFVYNTINKPANPPIQQMDLDDGVYLPLSYVGNGANGNFEQAAKIIKNIIGDCIKDLCDDKNWTLEGKHSKCLRIIINNTSHIDLPIYSIPDNEITTVTDSLTFSRMDSLNKFLSYDKTKNVLLATDNGWIKSDPRVIHEWVKNTKDQFGSDFIYYSRYFKAWRDYQWDKSKFSSIMIMAGIAQALSESSYYKNENVALNLSTIATSLKLYLSNGGIKDPDDSKKLDERLPDRDEIINKLDTLAIDLSEATKINNAQLLVNFFGDRFPNDTGNASNINCVAPAITTPSTAPIKQSRNFEFI